jgi:hypothetical protein
MPAVSAKRMLAIFLAAWLCAWAAPINMRAANPAPAPGAEITYRENVLPFISRNCFACHGNGKSKGDVTLDKYTDDLSVQNDRRVWDDVLDMLGRREMPPKERPQPSQAEVDQILDSINAVLAKLECGNGTNVGRVTLRRLNKTEYNNTIRDLLNVDFKPADDFPADDVGYGFDNIGDVLSVSPLLLEKYLTAAESVLDQAIVILDPPLPALTSVGSRRLPAAITAGETGGLASFDEGDYFIRAKLSVGSESQKTARAVLRVAGKDLKEFTVKATPGNPVTVETKVRLKPGTERVTVALANPGSGRALWVQSLEVEGPFNPPPPKYSDVQTRLLAHRAGLAPREAAREIVTRFAARAFRRPVRPGEVEKCLALYDASQALGQRFELGVRAALYRVLISPDFLFRIELDPPGAKAGAVYPVSELELASRLSYFLWNSMPDEELLTLATKGQLHRNLESQVHRMLKDPKSTSFLQSFCEQWLTLRKLELVSPDPQMFPAFDKNLQQSMIRESDLFFAAIAREDRSILDLLDAGFTYVNEPLAKLYGVPGIKGPAFVRVKAPLHRGGVLTEAGVLALTSNATRTSPVKRGKFVLDEILNTPPPPPPANVPPLDDGKQLTGTLRQIMEEHRSNPLCASCHEKMDPLGFAFENFDAIGAWREKDSGGFAIDASGVLPDGKSFTGAPGLKSVLQAKKDLFVRCLSEKMLTYSLGRGLEPYDRCAVDRIMAGLAKNNYRFSALVWEIVKSDPFQMRTAAGDTL